MYAPQMSKYSTVLILRLFHYDSSKATYSVKFIRSWFGPQTGGTEIIIVCRYVRFKEQRNGLWQAVMLPNMVASFSASEVRLH